MSSSTSAHIMSENINNIHLKFNGSLEDTFIWSSNKNGTYTTKSEYSWLLSCIDPVTHSNSNLFWSWIWKLKLPEKIKFFIWLACHISVPTVSLPNHRNMPRLITTFGATSMKRLSFIVYVTDIS